LDKGCARSDQARGGARTVVVRTRITGAAEVTGRDAIVDSVEGLSAWLG
jgi:hypothetical protein